ncbi:aspartate aminotransferase family protein [Zavarzinia compransoris]|uniref:aspartate aminotransferase family protein n=1 Tax=Zavarzinia marina TaxID=2911065 RepID=UPI001F1CB1FB|nr:aspartate aminotransferase family protein [Zavarzinia marina]MCF4164686.1 aspartate aminotransferase family protein [Zavarzinia marina]
MTEDAMIERRRRLLGPAYRLFYGHPLHIVRGEGVWLFDADGRRYLDVYNNVASLGHCHPEVVDATSRQAAVLNTHTRYLHDGILDYAERLLAEFPAAIGHLMMTCTGSEANDLALRIARRFTGGTGVIVTAHAYHGVTAALAELSPSLGPAIERGPHVHLVPAPTGTGDGFAAGVRAALARMAETGTKPAALLVDTIFSSDGVVPGEAGFLAPAVDAVRAAGGLFIADEVQPGFGRTGEALWGFARHGVVPDLVTLGKPMGNGHPVAGVVMRPEVVADFGRDIRYFNTFGGNPVSVAAADAVLNIVKRDDLAGNARRVGAYLAAGLRDLASRCDTLGEVRGAGLFVGADIMRDGRPARAEAARLVDDLRERGVLISATGPEGHTLKIRPPLVFTEAHADLFLETMAAALAAL